MQKEHLNEGPNNFVELGQVLIKEKTYLSLAKNLEALGRKRIILDRQTNEPYLVRYYYKNFRPFCRIVLHHILKSDIDGLHDHPWPAETIILSGGYWENVQKYPTDPNKLLEEEKHWRAPGYHGKFSANYFHRLELDFAKAKEDTWTLFMMGPKQKEWGFLNKDSEWMHHKEYLESLKARLK